MDRINNQYGNRRVENQIEDHARLHCSHTMSEQQRQVAKKVLSMPTDVQTDSHAERITNQQKSVR